MFLQVRFYFEDILKSRNFEVNIIKLKPKKVSLLFWLDYNSQLQNNSLIYKKKNLEFCYYDKRKSEYIESDMRCIVLTPVLTRDSMILSFKAKVSPPFILILFLSKHFIAYLKMNIKYRLSNFFRVNSTPHPIICIANVTFTDNILANGTIKVYFFNASKLQWQIW